MTRFIKALEQVSYRHRPDRVFRSFATLAACAVSAGTREAEYISEAKGWEPDEMQRMATLFGVMVEEMEAGPRFGDLLGKVYMEIASGSKNWGGEYYTPPDLCKMMAQLMIGDPATITKRPITIHEPASGSGAMVLATIEHLAAGGIGPRDVRVSCIDSSRVAADMCLINMTLWGIPADVTHGNTLSRETWGRWRNLHWHMVEGPMTVAEEILYLLREEGEDLPPELRTALPQPDIELQPRLFA